MRYGTFPTSEAEGTVLAHAVRVGDRRLQKGLVLSAHEIDLLEREKIPSVVAVRLDEGDLGEDVAAGRIAQAIKADHLRLSEAATGRVNIYATAAGLFTADKAVVDAFNRIDPAMTLACLADHVTVRPGDMVATIKIIPLAVAGELVAEAVRRFAADTPFAVKPFYPRSVTLVATELPSLKTSVMDRTAKLLVQRLAVSGSRLEREVRVPHECDAVASALRNDVAEREAGAAMIIVFGASAVADEDDVIPAAIRAAGGTVDHIGMPVDPGNLLVLGHLGEVPVIGAPGCARSPKKNGFDWILDRIMAGEMPSRWDISGMGVGGLLTEIPSRPLPRETVKTEDRPASVGAVLLAAGQARRMGSSGQHKLLAEFDNVPLVRRTAQILLAADLAAVVAVTGHRREEVEAALGGLDLHLQFNPAYATGFASSLVTGFSRPELTGQDGVLVMLADMPVVTAAEINLLIKAFRDAGGEAVVRAVFRTKRGNPVILPRSVYPAVRELEGDVGARAIIEASGLAVIDVDIGPAAHIDVDTPEAVIAAGGVLKG